MNDPHHRKIELQAPADLTYLLTNIRASAQQKLDSAFPPSAAPKGKEDALRTKVEELVQAVLHNYLDLKERGINRAFIQYINDTLALALPSLSINGLDPDSYPSLLQPPNTDRDPPSPTSPAADDTNYEAHDPRLAEKLRMLYMQHEQETTRVAEMRRDAPDAAARAYMERLNKEMQADREVNIEGGDEMQGVIELGGLERRDEVERMWGRGLDGLVALEGITEVGARLERAKRAVEVVEGM